MKKSFYLCVSLCLLLAACSTQPAQSMPQEPDPPAVQALSSAAGSKDGVWEEFHQSVFSWEETPVQVYERCGINFADQTFDLPYQMLRDKVLKSDRIESGVLADFQQFLKAHEGEETVSVTPYQLLTLEVFTAPYTSKADSLARAQSWSGQTIVICAVEDTCGYILLDRAQLGEYKGQILAEAVPDLTPQAAAAAAFRA